MACASSLLSHAVKATAPLALGGTLENSGVINERLGLRYMSYRQRTEAHIWMVTMNALTAQVNFLGQGYVG